jgi:hypothetical protein
MGVVGREGRPAGWPVFVLGTRGRWLCGDESGWQAEEETDAQTQAQPAAEAATWIDEDGLHALLPGTAPDRQMLEELTRRYHQHIRRSPCGTKWSAS